MQLAVASEKASSSASGRVVAADVAADADKCNEHSGDHQKRVQRLLHVAAPNLIGVR